jgi:hypothetical protein
MGEVPLGTVVGKIWLLRHPHSRELAHIARRRPKTSLAARLQYYNNVQRIARFRPAAGDGSTALVRELQRTYPAAGRFLVGSHPCRELGGGRARCRFIGAAN